MVDSAAEQQPRGDEAVRPGERQLGLRPLGNLLVLVASALLMLLEQRALDAAPEPPMPEAALRAVGPAVLAGVVLLARGRLRILVAPLLLGGTALVLVADRASMLYFQEPVRLAMRAGVHQLWDARDSVVELVSLGDWLLLGLVLGLSLTGGALAARRRVRSRTFRRAERLVGLLLLLTALPGALRSLSSAPTRPVLFREAALASVDEHGLLLHHAADLRATLFPPPVAPLRPGDREALLAGFARVAELNATTSPLHGVARGRHVVLLQLEAMQGFALGLGSPDGPVTPELDALARRGLSFGHVMDTTRSGRTSDAEWQVLTGLPVHTVGPVAYTHLRDDMATLPRALSAAGYHGVTMHAYHEHFWNRAAAHTAYGMDELLFGAHWRPGRELAWGLADEVFLTQAAEQLATYTQPTLTLVVTLSTHHPYTVQPEELRGWRSGFERPSLVDKYLRLVRYVDRAVGRFVRQLEESGLAEQVLLVIYGDHDAGLDAASCALVRDKLGLDPSSAEQDRVPLLIVVPGQEAALREARVEAERAWGTLTDVAPTVLHLLGEPVPAGMLGTHLFVPPGRREPLPLPHGHGFVSRGALHAADDWQGADGPDAELLRDAQRATHWLRLTDLALDHGLHAEAAALGAGGLTPPGSEGADALSGAVEWQLRREGLQPLPAGEAWLPFLGEGGPALSSWLAGAGGGADAALPEGLEVELFDALGRPVARRSSDGVAARLELSTPRARHGRVRGLGADPAARAVLQHQHAYGLVERALPTAAAAGWTWRGPARDVGSLLLAVAVPVGAGFDPDAPGEPVRTRLRAEAEGWSTERDLQLLPGGQTLLRLPCLEARGELVVRLEGDPVVAGLLGLSADGTRVR